MFFQWISFISSKFSSNNVLLIAAGLMAFKYANTGKNKNGQGSHGDKMCIMLNLA